MTVVQETFKDAAGTPASGSVTFTPCVVFTADTNNSDVIDQCPVKFNIVNGVLTTPDLEPGCYTVWIVLDCRGCPDPVKYTINLQDSPVPVELMDLIIAFVPLPPSVTEYVVSVAGLSGVVTLTQLQALLFPDDDRSYATTVGNGTVGPYTITHNLNSTDVDVTVRDLTTGYVVGVAWKVVNANTISVEPGVSWALNSRRVYVEKVT